jgi:SAM-dependent methyltransferase
MTVAASLDQDCASTLKVCRAPLNNLFVCPQTGAALTVQRGALVSSDGRRYPIVREIPRFVTDDKYVGSFSFEWNTHTDTQLDAFNGSASSEAIFAEKTALRPVDVAGKLVLDAGVGAGRFSDVLSRWGANVVGIDLSYAVEAAHANFRDRANVMIAQADIGKLPFADGTFDLIVSIGVLHHTPSTETYFKALVPKLKPGGRIVIWVYPNEGDYKIRNYWIPYTSRIPAEAFYDWCRWFVPWAALRRESLLVQVIHRLFPFSNQGLGMENDILDTFDGYSPSFHGIHSNAEVTGWFADTGLAEIKALPVLTSVTGIRPSSTGPAGTASTGSG